MNKTIKIAAVFGFTAVALGAFGAHALKDMLIDSGRLDTYETAVKYQFYHTIALLVIGFIQLSNDTKSLKWSANLMTIGIIIFSGSLYILCLSGITFLGAITPIGGLCLMAGWIALVKAH